MSVTILKSLAYSVLAISLVQAVAVDHNVLRRRQTYEVQKNVVVVEKVNVFQNPDGSLATAQATPVTTSVYLASPTPINVAKPISPPVQNNVASISALHDVQPEENSDEEPEQQNGEVPDEEQDGEQPDEAPVDEPILTDPSPSPEVKSTANAKPTLAATTVSTQSQVAPKPAPSTKDIPVEPSEPKSNSRISSSTLNETMGKVAASSRAKRGIAYNDVNKLSAFASSSKVSWAYNWGSSTPNIPNNIEFVPMLWGTGAHSDKWTENANSAIASGSTHLLAFNEPDLGAQSSLTVAEAVAGYQQLMQPFAGKAKLGSPAVTNGASPMGLSYLDNFISTCTGCTIDFVAIHWYNGGNADDFKNYVTKAHAFGGGRPVWITEFEASGDAGQQQAFLNDVLPWLDSQEYVERYAYFMASDGNLISSGTTLSSLGQAFAFGN
ncbi:putative uncharacterized serine-rich protein [Erysiphe necator]|uniref:Uncharacterized serine-rich protein n=1 Tax=Uncinula necator TaxID=52586 RepID=A0A0B1PBE4_UNCNE|nr:putative uncharacterized serine-rich protein [Erysiphe necator]